MLCCGRRCGCLTGPLRSYQSAFAAGQWLPDLKITNNMNREAILQARLSHSPEPSFEICSFCITLLNLPHRKSNANRMVV